MQKHILYVSLMNDEESKVAEMVSERFGYGKHDHAICIDAQLERGPFLNRLDFRLLANNRPEDCPTEVKINPTIDESELSGVLPYALQTIAMLERWAFFIGKDVDTRIRIYLHNIQFWNGYLRQNNIEQVVFFTYPHEVFDFIIYQLCKAMGIPTIIIGISIVENRNYCIRSIEDDIPELQERYQALCQEYRTASMEEIELSRDLRQLFDKMSDPAADKRPYYIKAVDFHRNHRITGEFSKENLSAKKKLERLVHLIKHPSWNEIARALKYSLRAIDSVVFKGRITLALRKVFSYKARMSKQLAKYYDKISVKPDYQAKYVYFPLHFQPECSSNPNGGGMYCEQSIPIRILADSLPDDVFVYVKEYPYQIYGARTKESYDELLKIPRVVLVKADVDTYELIQHAVAVSTLIGTAGWEGLFYGKPFIMFGYWVMQHCPGVYHVRTKAECRQAVDDILNGRYAFTKKDLRLYFKAMDETNGYSLFCDAGQPLLPAAPEITIPSTYAMIERMLIEA